MHNKSKIIILILLLILPVAIIFFVRQFTQPSYLISSLYKVIFITPVIYQIIVHKKTLKKAIFENFSFKIFRKNIFVIIGIGLFFALIYLVGFIIFKDFLDIDSIVNKLGQFASINATNIILIGLYIIIFNSLLEEFFWRGFILKESQSLESPIVVHSIIGIAFSFHHVIFYYEWFNLTFFILVTLGLVFYSIFLNFVFQKYKDLFSCWLIHGMVDVVQIYIALNLFGIV